MGGRHIGAASLIWFRILAMAVRISLEGIVSAFVITDWIVHGCAPRDISSRPDKCASICLSNSFKPCFPLNRIYTRRSLLKSHVSVPLVTLCSRWLPTLYGFVDIYQTSHPTQVFPVHRNLGRRREWASQEERQHGKSSIGVYGPRWLHSQQPNSVDTEKETNGSFTSMKKRLSPENSIEKGGFPNIRAPCNSVNTHRRVYQIKFHTCHDDLLTV